MPPSVGREEVRAILGNPKASHPGEAVHWQSPKIINCAGPWAGWMAGKLGYESPARAVRRQICLFDSRDVDLSPYGMMVDTSGVYFHPEATNGMAGFGSPLEREGYNYAYDGEGFFQDVIWPALYERSSKFERLRHLTGWAGLYEVSPDESGIIGATSLDGVFEAHSFSGHGVMQSVAVGRALAERILKGRYGALDLEPLSGERFKKGEQAWVRETQII